MIIRVIFISVFFIFSFSIYAQNENQIDDILASQIQDESESSEDIADYSEMLSEFLKRPIDLNKATAADLSHLIFLSPFQIQQILLHREKIGMFISPLELQVIPGINLEVLDQLLRFVKVKDGLIDGKQSLPELMSASGGSWMITYSRAFQVPRGYEISDPNRSRYLGTPDKVVNRIRWNARQKVKLSLNMEKDPGEPFLKEKQRLGFDHYSGSIQINKIGPFEKIIIGDYLIQFGQGLSLWNGAGFGKEGSVAHIMQQGLGLRPHTGMMESKFMRGIATHYKLNNVQFTPFISFNNLTATVDTKEASPFVSSINYSGLHRTPSELKNRHSLQQLVYGINMEYQQTRVKVGVNFHSNHFSMPLKLNTRAYSQNRFEGNNLQNASVYYQYNLYNLLGFGESAHSIGSGWAHNYGLIAALGRKFSASISYRNYTEHYHSFFAQSFQEQSNLANERGWHTSLVYHPTRKIEWINSLDYVEFPGRKFRAKLPSYSFQGRSQWSYIWNKKGHLRLRYQYKFFQENYPSELEEFQGIADAARQQARVIFLYKINRTFQIGNQIEGKKFHKSNIGHQYGFLVFQDIIWDQPKWKMGGNFRFAYFNADSYEARLFAFERDVLYSFSFPSYFREGYRIYLNQKIRPIKCLDIWLRYALTNYFNVDELGSSLEEIAGNQKSDIRFQIRYSW